MFETFYSLRRSPFARDLPTGELYESEILEETLGRLEYTAQRQWFAVVTGDCGTGKTTTIRRFADSLDAAKYKVLYLSDSKLTPRHFYKGLLEQLGCESKFYRGDAKRQLHREIEVMRGIHGLKPVVVVDEAHLLDREMLEEVRFLLNFKMDAQSPMALILVGQSELWERLHLQAYAAIRQRIDLQCKLPHYDRAQTGKYISRHMAYAGADRDIFTDGAIDDVYRFSSGAARLINKLCTHCLIYGAQNKHRIIDDHMVKRVIQGELSWVGDESNGNGSRITQIGTVGQSSWMGKHMNYTAENVSELKLQVMGCTAEWNTIMTGM